MGVGLDWCTQAQVTKVSNFGRISEGTTEIMPVLDLWQFWFFDYKHTDTCKLYN